MWWKNNKWKVMVPLMVAVVLAGAFFFGGKMPEREVSEETETVEPVRTEPEQAAPAGEIPEQTEAPVEETPPAETSPEPEPAPPSAEEGPAAEQPEAPVMEIDPEMGKDAYETDPVPEGKPLPVEPQDVTFGADAYTCTLSISCATILDNLELCDPEKAELIPADGWLLQPVNVTFYEGESVFHVLQRNCKQQSIHMEFMNTPIYNSAYIEGIGNLYEFDVGELSGWMYRVNGWFPNYGCSRYQLKDGDVIEWVYTCDLGSDVGGGYSAGVQKEE